MIEALSKGKSKYLRSLRRRKMRYQHKRFILEGEKICSELMEFFPDSIEFILVHETILSTNKFNTVFLREKLIQGTEEDFKEHSQLENPPKVMAVAAMPEWSWPTTDAGKWVFLDGIQDPGNMGTIIRTLSWFGFQGLILGPGCVDPYNAKVVQSSMGGLFQLPHFQANWEEVMDYLGHPKTFGLGLEGDVMQKISMPDNGVLILGSEGKGLSPAVAAQIDQWLHIPKGPAAQMESLNASVALGIAAAHWMQKPT